MPTTGITDVDKAWAYFETMRKKLEGFTMSTCGNTREQAEDVVSDVGIGFVRNLHKIKHITYERYLYVACYNRGVSASRRAAREFPVADTVLQAQYGPYAIEDRHAMGDLLAIELQVAIEQGLTINETDSEILALRALGLSVADIAESEGIHLKAAKSRLLRARARASEALGEGAAA